MLRITLFAALAAAAAGFNAPMSKASVSAARPAVAAPRFADVRMDEPSDKAVAIGAASVGGILGVYLFGDLGTAAFLAIVGAYGSTLSNGFGDATKSAGTFASKAYGKSLEINEEYDVLPKAKSALDTGPPPPPPGNHAGRGLSRPPPPPRGAHAPFGARASTFPPPMESSKMRASSARAYSARGCGLC